MSIILLLNTKGDFRGKSVHRYEYFFTRGEAERSASAKDGPLRAHVTVARGVRRPKQTRCTTRVSRARDVRHTADVARQVLLVLEGGDVANDREQERRWEVADPRRTRQPGVCVELIHVARMTAFHTRPTAIPLSASTALSGTAIGQGGQRRQTRDAGRRCSRAVCAILASDADSTLKEERS